MSDITDYVDALDHIMRVARKSRTQSRRLRWIEARARCALEGGEDWKELDLPKFSESNHRYLQARVAELEQQLATAQAEARELRAALARARELAAKWRSAPQNPEEPILAMAADELDAALSPAPEPRSTHAVWRGGEWLPCYCLAGCDHGIGSEQTVKRVTAGTRRAGERRTEK